MVENLIEQTENYFTDVTKLSKIFFYDNILKVKGYNEEVANETEKIKPLWLLHKLYQTLIEDGWTDEDIELAMPIHSAESIAIESLPEQIDKQLKSLIGKTENKIVWTIGLTRQDIKRLQLDENSVYVSEDKYIKFSQATEDVNLGNVFDIDILNDIEIDSVQGGLTDKLPKELGEAIQHDKEVYVILNIPDVVLGDETQISKNEVYKLFKSRAYNLPYVYLWQLLNIIKIYDLSNLHICLFMPVKTFIQTKRGHTLTTDLKQYVTFEDGFIIDSKKKIEKGKYDKVAITLWQATYGHPSDRDIDIQRYELEKNTLKKNGRISSKGEVETDYITWLQDAEAEANRTVEKPKLTSYLTYAGVDLLTTPVKVFGNISRNTLGVLSFTQTMTDPYSTIVLSAPPKNGGILITEKNLWRCVASYTFKRVYLSQKDRSDLKDTKQKIHIPDETKEGYKEWLYNALIYFLFDKQNRVSAIKNITAENNGYYEIRNNLFFLTKDEALNLTTNADLIKDIEENGDSNQVILTAIEESRPSWYPETKELYDTMKAYVYRTYSHRETYNFTNGTNCWDAGIQQLNEKTPYTKEEAAKYKKSITKLRDTLQKNCLKWGFLS